MGTTFSTIQIKNNHLTKPNDILIKYMEKKGYIPTDEDSAALSYRLAFSDKSDWVTLSSPEYENGTRIQEDAEGIAKTLKTYCIAIGVWDSDMLTLDLYGSSSKEKDKVFAGRPFADDMPVGEANRELWEKLLAEDKTWEQLSDVLNGDYTFMEDSLTDIAPILGMDSDIIETYHCWGDAEKDNVNDITLHFKKKDEKKKSVSLNAAFKQIFGEALEPLGFKLIKSKYPYFVRVIGDEILHIITIKSERTGETGYKAFNILGGVATVYRQRISLNLSPQDNNNWLKSNHSFFTLSNPDIKFKKSIYQFTYNEKTMFSMIGYALKTTKEIMISELNKVIDINKCIDFYNKFNLSVYFCDGEDLGNSCVNEYYNEGLLYIKINNYGDFISKMKTDIDSKSHDLKMARFQQIAICDRIFNDPEMKKKVLTELEQRKNANFKILKSYGFNL